MADDPLGYRAFVLSCLSNPELAPLLSDSDLYESGDTLQISHVEDEAWVTVLAYGDCVLVGTDVSDIVLPMSLVLTTIRIWLRDERNYQTHQITSTGQQLTNLRTALNDPSYADSDEVHALTDDLDLLVDECQGVLMDRYNNWALLCAVQAVINQSPVHDAVIYLQQSLHQLQGAVAELDMLLRENYQIIEFLRDYPDVWRGVLIPLAEPYRSSGAAWWLS